MANWAQGPLVLGPRAQNTGKYTFWVVQGKRQRAAKRTMNETANRTMNESPKNTMNENANKNNE